MSAALLARVIQRRVLIPGAEDSRRRRPPPADHRHQGPTVPGSRSATVSGARIHHRALAVQQQPRPPPLLLRTLSRTKCDDYDRRWRP
eukprot:5034541-Pyramimonas_sp.AAC.1